MTQGVIGSRLRYYEWHAPSGDHISFVGEVRVVPGGGQRESRYNPMHITVIDPAEQSGFRNINNVPMEEDYTGDEVLGESYYRWLDSG